MTAIIIPNTPEFKKQLSEFKDPFSSKRVARVCIEIKNNEVIFDNPSLQARGTEYEATIQFKNGSTGGSQFLTSESFEGLIEKIKSFTESLP